MTSRALGSKEFAVAGMNRLNSGDSPVSGVRVAGGGCRAATGILRPSEKDVQKAILEYLKLRGFFCWRNNTGAMVGQYNGKQRFFRFGAVGSGDILGLTKSGVFFSIEVKAPGKKATPEQEEFMAGVRRNGGHAFVAHSVDDVEVFL